MTTIKMMPGLTWMLTIVAVSFFLILGLAMDGAGVEAQTAHLCAFLNLNQEPRGQRFEERKNRRGGYPAASGYTGPAILSPAVLPTVPVLPTGQQTEEHGVTLDLRGVSVRSRKGVAYYDGEMGLNRGAVLSALSALVEEGTSVFKPVLCLDALSATGAAGLAWKKALEDRVQVQANDPREAGFQCTAANCKLNRLDVQVSNCDVCVLLHQKPFNFIFLDCYGASTQYLDAAFRNLPKNGVLIVTSTDDASLYGKAPEATRKNYGGFLVKTFYAKEMAIRLVLAQIARSAAKCNKGISVLCSIALKGFFTVVVRCVRGPSHAADSLSHVRRLIHCCVCEDRAFYPQTQYPEEHPYRLLHCKCHDQLPGKSALELGPLWSGPIFSAPFISHMIRQADKLGLGEKLGMLLRLVLDETKCDRSSAPPADDSADPADPAKRPRLELEKVQVELETREFSSPLFYFNLHRHSPRGMDLPRTGRAIACLQQSGFRASRTHFDPEAVRTDATLPEFTSVLTAYKR